MKVLIIPEDFRKDQYMLKPIVEAMMAALGKPKSIVRVCTDPLLGGISNALDVSQVQAIVDRYKGMVDLFLLLVDRDGAPGRTLAIAAIERNIGETLPATKALIGENAWQELEVWLLAGQDDHGFKWADVRGEMHPKETYYLPYARARGVVDQPAEGRDKLGKEAAARYPRIRQLCPDDAARLESRVRAWMESNG